jgi:ATP-dependent helicase HepA
MLSDSEQKARSRVPDMIASAHRQGRQTLLREINRLKALQLINPSVRDDEISWFENQLAELRQVLDSASLRLDALRVLVTI